jgi:hypothetical protein
MPPANNKNKAQKIKKTNATNNRKKNKEKRNPIFTYYQLKIIIRIRKTRDHKYFKKKQTFQFKPIFEEKKLKKKKYLPLHVPTRNHCLDLVDLHMQYLIEMNESYKLKLNKLCCYIYSFL